MNEVPSETQQEIKVCSQCGSVHSDPEISFCECGACLYKHSKQIPDSDLPLFKCLKCRKTVFWD